jgi:hypothetical protein
MRMKSCGLGLLAMLILALGSGCKKSPSESTSSKSQTTNPPSPAAPRTSQNGPIGERAQRGETLNPQLSTTIARVHWLGKKRIAAQKTAGRFMSLWNLPEALTLEAQTIDKLALAIGGASNDVNAALQSTSTNAPLVFTNYPALVASNHTAALLRPLLDDLVREEAYLEVEQRAGQPAELAIAVRLEEPRADLWTSNVTAVLSSLTNVQSIAAPASRLAWRFAPGPAVAEQNGKDTTNGTNMATTSVLGSRPSTIEMARAGEWTVVGFAPETNGLLAELCHRIQVDQTPVPAAVTNSALQMNPVTRKVSPAPESSATAPSWLDVDLDLNRLSTALAFGWHLPDGWPRISATWTSTGEYVRIAGELIFAKPLGIQLEPWNIPTNLIHDPIFSFTALRGLRPWLARQNWFSRFQVDPVPDQLSLWASTAVPVFTFAATPMTNAATALRTFGPRVAAELNPWITNNALGALLCRNEPAGLSWNGIPMFTPAIEAVAAPGGDFLVGGLGGTISTNGKAAPPGLFAQLNVRPNLVYYNWEFTQAKVAHWTYIGQTLRLALMLPQMDGKSAAFAFLLAAAPSLGNTGTEILQDGPAHMRFLRNSSLGFTGAELHLLADWLESPAFPRGLHSLLAPRPAKKPVVRPGMTSVPAMPSAGPTSTNPVVPQR